MSASREDIQAEIGRLKRDLVRIDLEGRGSFEFVWGGVSVVAVAVERHRGRSLDENYWEAKVGGRSLAFCSTDQRAGIPTAWEVYTNACGGYRNQSGASPQEAADRMYKMLCGFRDDINGFFEGAT